MPMISVVIPVYNEEKNVSELHRQLLVVLKDIHGGFEIIFVDDGSCDKTFEELKKLKQIRAFRLQRNFGQTTAFGCGIQNARGDTIVTMDGDLENSPEDIPKLLKKLNEGYDVAAGWRKNRWPGQFLTRRFPSVLANKLISWMTQVPLHDHGCNLRAYRREVFQGILFNGEMHRMLAAHLGMRGFKVAEIPVRYEPRRFGTSKYGLSRTFRVLLDVLAFYFFREFGTRPMHFFGYAGFIITFMGFLTFCWALFLRVFQGIHFNRTPLPILVAIFIVVGFQCILMGLLAEIMIRTRPTDGKEQLFELREGIEQ